MAEQQYLLAVAHQAGPDVRIAKGVDGSRDWFTPEELELAAWSLLNRASMPEVGIFHADGTVGHARIVESYIWRGEPWTITAVDGSSQTVNPGDWLVGLLLDDVAWRLYKDGQVQGVSIQGVARRRRRPAA